MILISKQEGTQTRSYRPSGLQKRDIVSRNIRNISPKSLNYPNIYRKSGFERSCSFDIFIT